MECKICNKQVITNSGLMSHVRRIHKIDFVEYMHKYYIGDKIIKKCGNCDKNSEFYYRIDDTTSTYNRI